MGAGDCGTHGGHLAMVSALIGHGHAVSSTELPEKLSDDD